MRALSLVLGVALVVSPYALSDCGGSTSNSPPSQADANSPTDGAASDAPEKPETGASCDDGSPFGPPVLLDGLVSESNDVQPTLSRDELTIYFASDRSGTRGAGDIYRASRTAITDVFRDITHLDLNTSAMERHPTFADDGATLFFESDRYLGSYRIFEAHRSGSMFSVDSVPALDALASDAGAHVRDPFLVRDGTTLYFALNNDIWRARRIGDNITSPEPVSEVNSADLEGSPVLSFDQRTLLFVRAGRILIARRAAADAPFSVTGDLQQFGDFSPAWLSADGCRLYLTGHSDAGVSVPFHIYLATR